MRSKASQSGSENEEFPSHIVATVGVQNDGFRLCQKTTVILQMKAMTRCVLHDNSQLSAVSASK